LLFIAGVSEAPASPRLIEVRTTVSAPDSVTVGERFEVTHLFSYPDSLAASVPREIDPGSCRIVSFVWTEDKTNGTVEKAVSLSALTLDLEQATLPALAMEFFTPSGDTIVAFADEVTIPVRHLAAAGAEVRPLKEQWEAPRRYWPWFVAAAALAAAALLLWWWIRRRRRLAEVTPHAPALPADYVALTELTRIERLNLLKNGEFKAYYTLVTDAIRRYLAARFGVEAMDRTTGELLGELEDRERRVEKLGDLLHEADLVKFAKFVPGEASGTAAMSSAREIVVKTTPRHSESPEEQSAGAGAATMRIAGAEEENE
jgi:hypothetical protein